MELILGDMQQRIMSYVQQTINESIDKITGNIEIDANSIFLHNDKMKKVYESFIISGVHAVLCELLVCNDLLFYISHAETDTVYKIGSGLSASVPFRQPDILPLPIKIYTNYNFYVLLNVYTSLHANIYTYDNSEFSLFALHIPAMHSTGSYGRYIITDYNIYVNGKHGKLSDVSDVFKNCRSKLIKYLHPYVINVWLCDQSPTESIKFYAKMQTWNAAILQENVSLLTLQVTNKTDELSNICIELDKQNQLIQMHIDKSNMLNIDLDVLQLSHDKLTEKVNTLETLNATMVDTLERYKIKNQQLIENQIMLKIKIEKLQLAYEEIKDENDAMIHTYSK